MNELSLVLQKEQEVKKRINKAKEQAEVALEDRKNQLKKKLESISLKAEESGQLDIAKKKKIDALEKLLLEKNQKEFDDLLKIEKEKSPQAVDYLVEKILCLK